MRSQINWGRSSTEQRRALYLVIREVMAENNLTLDQVFEAVMGKPFALGTDYESNFRNGRISRGKAVQIYRWLQREHPAYARAVEKSCLGEHYRDNRPLNELSTEELKNALQMFVDGIASSKAEFLNAVDEQIYDFIENKRTGRYELKYALDHSPFPESYEFTSSKRLLKA